MAYRTPYDNPNLPPDVAYCADWEMRHCGGGERGRRRLLELCRFYGVEPPRRALRGRPTGGRPLRASSGRGRASRLARPSRLRRGREA